MIPEKKDVIKMPVYSVKEMQLLEKCGVIKPTTFERLAMEIIELSKTSKS